MAKYKTISKGIIKRGSSYTFTVALGIDCKGKQIRKTMTFKVPEAYSEKKSDQMAIAEYEVFKNKCKGHICFNENLRFNDLINDYFEVYAINKLKPITIYNYQKIVDSYISPYLGNKSLKHLNHIVLINFLKDIHEKENLKDSSIKNIFTVLQSILSFGVKSEYLNESPCSKVILPCDKYKHNKQRKYLKEDELADFIRLFNEENSFNTIIKFLLYTGMRSGECLGLMWSDINFEDKTIMIQRNLSEIAGTFSLTTPKSNTSVRQIAMCDALIEILKKHQEAQNQLQQKVGSSFKYPEMVFTSSSGNYKNRNCLNRSFKRYLKNTKFDFMTLHCFRHTNATLLLNNGVDIKIVSDHLGHANIGVTANVYANVYASSRRKTALILDSILNF